MLNMIKIKLKDAMKLKDKDRINTLRNILAKLKLKEIEKNDALTDPESIKVLQSMSKQLNESIRQYKDGGRIDLANNEAKELEILNEFLPEPMSENEIIKIIVDTIDECQAESMKDMGKVMGIVIKKTDGKADGSVISKIVKEKLS
ncbi:MAG: glutamyl-tRNA amidotransferase [Candidatus Marinimicrobia bacterium]|nr:glutamyl-tRNA amidotransferase [Candidatus Neomarinimicrobiota bacterium]|tara:strand:+ start:69 stop:506 length:438 start_codon:yes stop_codon:yes gene_type:complete